MDHRQWTLRPAHSDARWTAVDIGNLQDNGQREAHLNPRIGGARSAIAARWFGRKPALDKRGIDNHGMDPAMV